MPTSPATGETNLGQGYDLLNGPYRHLAPNKKLVNGLLTQATKLADLLKVAFNTPSGVPDNDLTFQPYPQVKGGLLNGLATTGTLVLEWSRLSDLTGNPEYGKLARKAEEYLLKPQPSEAEPFPGMVGSQIFVENGTFADIVGSWAGGTDSFYEYLIKMFVYDPKRYGFYKDRWVAAVESSMKYLVSHPTTRPDLTFLAMYSGNVTFFYGGHRKYTLSSTL
jgi:mannosyl-oligosaccharide alpha-1,2-mannosidase